MEDQHIFRIGIRTNFTIIPNSVLNDAELSAEAVGVLVYLLSKPDNWEVHDHQLRVRFNLGREKLAGIIKELKVAGYMERKQIHSGGGKFETITSVYDHKVIVDGSAVAGKPVSGSTVDGKTVDGSAVDGKTVDGSAVDGKPVAIIRTDPQRTDPQRTEEEKKSEATPQPPAPVIPATVKPAKKQKPEPVQKPEAVKVYKSVLCRWPNKALDNLIGDTVGNEPEALMFWENVVRGWVATGWNPGNVKGMLDFFSKGEIPGTYKKESNTNGNKNFGTSKPARENRGQANGIGVYADAISALSS